MSPYYLIPAVLAGMYLGILLDLWRNHDPNSPCRRCRSGPAASLIRNVRSERIHGPRMPHNNNPTDNNTAPVDTPAHYTIGLDPAPGPDRTSHDITGRARGHCPTPNGTGDCTRGCLYVCANLFRDRPDFTRPPYPAHPPINDDEYVARLDYPFWPTSLLLDNNHRPSVLKPGERSEARSARPGPTNIHGMT